jgi:hypothetical protein
VNGASLQKVTVVDEDLRNEVDGGGALEMEIPEPRPLLIQDPA